MPGLVGEQVWSHSLGGTGWRDVVSKQLTYHSVPNHLYTMQPCWDQGTLGRDHSRGLFWVSTIHSANDSSQTGVNRVRILVVAVCGACVWGGAVE